MVKMNKTGGTYRPENFLQIKLINHSCTEPKEYAFELITFSNNSNDYVQMIAKVFHQLESHFCGCPCVLEV